MHNCILGTHSVCLHPDMALSTKNLQSCFWLEWVGLTLPGVIARIPINYVNAVQLGPCPLAERIELGLSQFFQI
jgi:hypothetical protein